MTLEPPEPAPPMGLARWRLVGPGIVVAATGVGRATLSQRSLRARASDIFANRQAIGRNQRQLKMLDRLICSASANRWIGVILARFGTRTAQLNFFAGHKRGQSGNQI